jgi:protein-disulfide isomerase
MSRKTQRNRATPDGKAPKADEPHRMGRIGRTRIIVGTVAALLVAIAAATLLYNRDGTQPSELAAATTQAALASSHSPTLGDATAKVHVVEFLDPACETCAEFFPLVKQRMTENPGKIRLSVRHVAFHDGSDYVVRLLEASRKQDKYWQTLETLLATQSQWAPNHTAYPDLVGQAIAGVGLNVDQLMADINDPGVTQRMEQDRNDAMTLKVTATPEYFVNGRPMPSFGVQQLQDLISEALQSAY